LLSASSAADQIELNFNEPVHVLGLRLIDAAGADCSPVTTPRSEDGKVFWKWPAPLQRGRYLVSWRAESIDGHIVSGTFTFGVGAAGEGVSAAEIDPETPGAQQPRPWIHLGFHAASRLLALFAIGTALFRFLLAPEDPDGWLGMVTRRLGVGGAAALALFIAAEGAMRAGLPMVYMFSREALIAALGAQSVGWRIAGVIGLVLVAASGKRKLQGLGAILAVASMADAGHALSVLPKGFGHGLMLVHGLAAAMWIGAIAPLRHALLRDAGPVTLALFRRFQTYGGLAMGATLGSGLVLTWLLLPHLSDLWQSGYGLRLSAKLAAVGTMVLIATGNRLMLTWRALAGRERIRTLLGTILGFDVVAAAMATVLAVGLSLGPPPSPSLEVVVAGGSYDGTLSFTPGKTGDNDLLIALAPKAGSAIDPLEVEVRLTVAGLEPIARKATRIGAGRYAVHQLPLWMSGKWNVQLHMLIDDFTSLELSAPVTIRQSQTSVH
jgi:copper transport protein